MNGKRVIVIDDDRDIWNAYKAVLAPDVDLQTPGNQITQFLLDPGTVEALAKPEYDLCYAPQGMDGFEKVKEELAKGDPFSVAFIDIRMPPGWDGVKTATEIRKIDTNIEIVIVTAFSDLSRREIVQSIGTPDKLLYLRKPFDADELGQVALSLTEKSTMAAQERLQQEKIKTLLVELQKTKDYLDSMIGSMPSILVGVQHTGEVTQWNRQAEKITGIGLEQAKMQNIGSLFPQLSEINQYVAQAIEGDAVQHQEKVMVDFGAGMALIDITVYPLLTEDLKGAVIRIDDVSERARMEEIMIQSDKMQSVGGLAAGMAHEINTPLGSIIQNTQIMANRLSLELNKNRQQALECGTDIETIRDYMERRGFFQLLEGVRDAGSRTSKIVKSMLSFSRRSSAMAEYQIPEILDEAVDLAMSDYDLKKHYRFRDFEIVRDYDDGARPVMCEKTKIEQVVLNLLKNAAHAMADRPSEHRPRIVMRIQYEAEMVRIEIADNGPGIGQEIIKRIFEPFFTTKEIGLGTGLGLSLTYFIIVENHKGKIRVKSELGEGTTFIIQMPYVRSDADAQMDNMGKTIPKVRHV